MDSSCIPGCPLCCRMEYVRSRIFGAWGLTARMGEFEVLESFSRMLSLGPSTTGMEGTGVLFSEADFSLFDLPTINLGMASVCCNGLSTETCQQSLLQLNGSSCGPCTRHYQREPGAFSAYARLLPNDCLDLGDKQERGRTLNWQDNVQHRNGRGIPTRMKTRKRKLSSRPLNGFIPTYQPNQQR